MTPQKEPIQLLCFRNALITRTCKREKEPTAPLKVMPWIGSIAEHIQTCKIPRLTQQGHYEIEQGCSGTERS